MEKGVWRTIGGRRVFIKDGQGLYDAMRESGKFKNIKERNGTNNKARTIKNDYDSKVYSNDIRGEKEKLADKLETARQKYLESLGKKDYNNKDWWNENNRLQEEYYNMQKKYDEKFKEYIRKEKGELSWQDKVKLNDMEGQIERENIDVYRDNDKYYETYRNAERKNAKLKVEEPNEKYESISAYAGFRDKFYENFSIGAKHENDLISAKIYTNDEFMEHLTDANWHTERRMLEQANLTNKQMEYVKNNTKVGAYTSDLNKEKTERLIKEAKEKYPSYTNEGTRYSVTGNSIAKYNNLFTEYKRLHPNTKMNLQQFAKMMMDLD